MRWTTFLVFALLAIVVERSLLDALTLRGFGGIRPSAVATLAVFVALFAPRHTALWAAWLLGLLLDLSFPLQRAGGAPLFLVGPNALGLVAACYGVLLVRPMVFRRRVLTLGMLTLGAMAISGVVVVTLITIRTWYPGSESLAAHSSGLQRLLWSWGGALYTAVFALPIGFVLYLTMPIWAFYHAGPRSATSR